MRPEHLDVNLRPRSSWEAMELGTALVRRHAAAIWKPWLLLTVPLFVLFNAVGWALDMLWLAGLLMWWLKPLFARLPLYVISRGVFGQVPGTWQTLRAQAGFGLRLMPAYLLWRRLGPARALLMPVDLLEGTAPEQRRLRRRVLGGPAYGQGCLLTWTCWHFELVLAFGCVAAVFLMIPTEFLAGSFQSFWARLEDGMPLWMQLAWNAFAWAGVCVIEPFYVGAGFGMYLNRRTETEAWDVELAFRRLRDRLRTPLAPLLLALAVAAPLALLPTAPVHAQVPSNTKDAFQAAPAPPGAESEAEAGVEPDAQDDTSSDVDPDVESPADPEADPAQEQAATLEGVFDGAVADDAGFRSAARRTYEDPLLGSSRTVSEWQRKPEAETSSQTSRPDLGDWAFMDTLVTLFALVAEWGIWVLVGVLVILALATMRYWLPWIRGSARRAPAPEAAAPRTDALVLPETLPDDVPAAARRLWHEGRQRAALALLYRASVEAMAERTAAVLPPGATEAQCLRVSRRLEQEPARTLFARMVRTWQYAAYAGQVPDEAEFEALLEASRAEWSWTA